MENFYLKEWSVILVSRSYDVERKEPTINFCPIGAQFVSYVSFGKDIKRKLTVYEFDEVVNRLKSEYFGEGSEEKMR